jgi:hypothetical protein
MSLNAGGGRGVAGVSANECRCAPLNIEPKINLGGLTIFNLRLKLRQMGTYGVQMKGPRGSSLVGSFGSLCAGTKDFYPALAALISL